MKKLLIILFIINACGTPATLEQGSSPDEPPDQETEETNIPPNEEDTDFGFPPFEATNDSSIEDSVDGFWNVKFTVVKDTFYSNGVTSTDSTGDEDYLSVEILELGSPELIRITGIFGEHEYTRIPETGGICETWDLEIYSNPPQELKYDVCGAIAGDKLFFYATMTLYTQYAYDAANSAIWREEGYFDYELLGWKRD